MINLLPDTDKQQLKAARHNVLLVRYIFMSLLAIGGLYFVMRSSEQILTDTKTSALELIETNTTEAGIYSDTARDVSQLTDSLASAQAVLDQEVHYSKLLRGIAAQMPEGTVIDSIDVKTESIQLPVTLTAYGKTTEAILGLQAAFRSSPLFSSVEFQSVSETGGTIEGYPVSVTMTVSFNKAGIQ